jgi:hypothetical protein
MKRDYQEIMDLKKRLKAYREGQEHKDGQIDLFTTDDRQKSYSGQGYVIFRWYDMG